MKISTMRFIIEVSKWKSINKASKHLYINQQQLSRMIATMESDLEVEIFYRNTKGIFLTPEGEKIVKKFEQIVALYDSITEKEETDERIRGKITILTETTIWTGYAQLYKAFAKTYPDIHFSIQNMATEEIIQTLLEYEGVGMISRVLGEGISDYEIPEALEFFPVANDRLMVYGAVENPYVKKYKTISLATLCELPLINFKPYNHHLSLMERVFVNVGEPNIKYEVNNIRVFRELIAETDCLFVTFRRPKYVSEDGYSEIALRDKIFFENGIVKKKASKSKLDEIFADFYLDYYRRLY